MIHAHTYFRRFAAPLLAATAMLFAAPAADAQRLDGAPYARQTMEQDTAHNRTQRGELRTFDELLPRAQRAAGPSKYIGVEPDIRRMTYRFKFVRTDSRVVWVDMDGRTGRVLAVH